MEQAGQIISEALVARELNIALAVVGVLAFALLVFAVISGWTLIKLIASAVTMMKSLNAQTDTLTGLRLEQERTRADQNMGFMQQGAKIDKAYDYMQVDSLDRKRKADEISQNVQSSIESIGNAKQEILGGIGNLSQTLDTTNQTLGRIEDFVIARFNLLSNDLSSTKDAILAQITTMMIKENAHVESKNLGTSAVAVLPVATVASDFGTGSDNRTQ